MSELFQIPDAPADRLTVARSRLSRAEAAHEDAMSVPPERATAFDQQQAEETLRERDAARMELQAAERERMQK